MLARLPARSWSVKKTEPSGFGKTSLREVKRKLADLGLSLGMDLDAVPTAAGARTLAPLIMKI